MQQALFRRLKQRLEAWRAFRAASWRVAPSGSLVRGGGEIFLVPGSGLRGWLRPPGEPFLLKAIPEKQYRLSGFSFLVDSRFCKLTKRFVSRLLLFEGSLKERHRSRKA